MELLGIHNPKGLQVLSFPYQEIFFSMDVTCDEDASYFTQPYLQEEAVPVLEDEDRDSFLLELPSATPAAPTPSIPASVEPSHSLNKSPNSKQFDHVYSRRKRPEVAHEQIQESKPNSENEALEKNKTWKTFDLPPGKKVVGCKCVFTIKYKSDGSLDRYEAKLVAKGYTQTYGVDYQETFAPFAKMNTS